MGLEMLLKGILARSVENLGTSLESVLYSRMKTRNIKNTGVTKKTEGTWYLVTEIVKLLLIWL